MKIQVAFDDVTGERCLEILENCSSDIDIAEAGTLLIIKEGLAPLKEMRKRFPKALLLADPKIMDAPEKIAKACFEAGADIVTVMSAAGKEVVSKVVQTAAAYKGSVMADLLGCKDTISAAKEADELGADYVCVHTSTEGKAPSAALSEIKKALKNAKLAAAGGIKADSLSEYRDADVIIVGSAVYGAEDPCLALKAFKEKMDEL